MFRNKIDKEIDSDMTIDILTHLGYPFGKYKNASGKNIYPTAIIEGYFDTPFDRRRIEHIIETIRHNRTTSDEIRQRYEKLAREHTMPEEDFDKLRKEIETEDRQRYEKYLDENPPETSMKYVSDVQLFNDDVMYESANKKDQLSDVESEWEPEDGLFSMKSANYIANYLIKNSEDVGQAIKRLTFYMNRSGKNLKNRTVLNKAKRILQDKKEKEMG